MMMSFFSGREEALAYKGRLTEMFREYNEREKPPFTLKISIGFSRYAEGQSVEALTEAADRDLYEEKKKNKTGRRTTVKWTGSK